VKFGIANAIRNHPARAYALADVYRDYIGDAVLAEQLGFSFSWYGEHRMTPCQWTPSPLAVCAWVAAKTSTLRVGPQVLCLPFHNPLRVAEDVAVIDVMSNGRFDFGIGVGSQFEEFRTFGINPDERVGRTWEAAELIERCFSETETFSFKGKYYDFPEVSFTTKPVQSRMPIWWGGEGPKNLQRAAQRGYHLMAGGNLKASNAFDEALRAAGRNPAYHCIGPMTFTCIADTEEQAWEASLEGIHYFINFYMLRRNLKGEWPPASNEFTRAQIRASNLNVEAPWSLAVGSRDQGARYFEKVRDGARGRITHMVISPRHAGMTTAAAHRTLRNFASDVMPLFK
jgi:alkanesulfonate monooxygenase SsuD/methylene tetrahydromethanopterin reductase-like flavin-dependent oxidoreductase (luciferase family)